MLTAHYRSTLDFSNEALQAAEKGMDRLLKATETLENLKAGGNASTVNITELKEKCYAAMNDDLNSPIAIAHLFDGVKMINSVADGKATISAADLEALKSLYNTFIFDLFGLKKSEQAGESNEAFNAAIDLLLQLRQDAKASKDWATADKIRNELTNLGFVVKDTKDGASWELK
jgi:cysteinyl-tRNA synthetase